MLLRVLSDPSITADNFYGFVCCDCLCGYFCLPTMTYLIGNDDEDDTQFDTKPNSGYKHIKRSGTGLHDDTVHSSVSYAQLSDSALDTSSPRVEIDDAILDNPDEAYYRRFNTVEHIQSKKSPRSAPTSDGTRLDDERSILISCDETTTERATIRRCLTRYQHTIASMQDLDKKRTLVDEYAVFKSKYDADDKEEAEYAELHIEYARNQMANKLGDADRIEHYQKAITFTNDLDAKNALKQEYRRFCYRIKETRTGAGNTI